MMQDHDHAPRENREREAGRGEGQEGEIFSFQEVVYPPGPGMSRWLQYLIGVGIGAIPLVSMLLSASRIINSFVFGILGQIAIYGIVGIIIGMIVCLCVPRIRFVGYGLLTMVLASPVIFYISCVVSMSICGGYRSYRC